jgi:carboxyl-terminal processing protease
MGLSSMPQRNLLTVVCLSLVCLACYSKAPTNRYARVYERALRIVDKHYVTPQDKRKLFEASLQGMMQSLDEHSVYLPPLRLDEMNQKLEQVYGGVGIRIDFDPKAHLLLVISPILDSPAFKAGIQPGDVIVQIDGVKTKELTADNCIARMKGPIGEMIRLTVQRSNENTLREFNLERAQISVPSVLGQTRNKDGSWNYLLEQDDRVLYMHITDFGRETSSELRQLLETDKLGYEAVVIDLRDNGGGLLETAIEVCNMFIAEGVIVSTRGRGGTLLEEFKAEPEMVIDRAIPMAILINDNSASASEIMAGCLQDHNRAVIVGERSYGKGSVQNIISLESGKSALKLTTASFWRPSGQNIQRSPGATEDEQWGIHPDKGFEVVFSEDDWKQYRDFRYRYSFSPGTFQPRTEDLEAPGDGDLTDPRPDPTPDPVDFKDRQLDRAMEYLRDELQKQDVVLLSPR